MASKSGKDNKTERKYYNSAIGSWSGYIYQGLCAIYVVLHLIHDDLANKKNKYANCKLYLDAFEDFSIHDENDIAISLHQCKLYKKATDFTEARTQMENQYHFLIEDKKANEATRLFFHSNLDVVETSKIKKYNDCNGNTKWDGEEIIKSIEIILEKIININKYPSNPQNVAFRMMCFIDSHVVHIHKKFFDSPKQLREITREQENAIKLSRFKTFLEHNGNDYSNQKYFWQRVKYMFLHTLKQKNETYKETGHWERIGTTEDHMQIIEYSIAMMDPLKFKNIASKIYPTLKTDENDFVNCNIANEGTAHKLFTIIGKCKHKISDELDWNVGEKKETPILSPYNDPDELTLFLVDLNKNRPNLDVLQEYDWLISNKIDKTINDINEALRSITDIEDKDPNDIFNGKKVGILKLNEFNNWES